MANDANAHSHINMDAAVNANAKTAIVQLLAMLILIVIHMLLRLS